MGNVSCAGFVTGPPACLNSGSAQPQTKQVCLDLNPHEDTPGLQTYCTIVSGTEGHTGDTARDGASSLQSHGSKHDA